MEKLLGSEIYAAWASQVAMQHPETGDYVAVGGVQMLCIGTGMSRIALRAPDSVVYKVERPYTRGIQTQDELELFRFACEKGYSWAPDFWYYQDYNVMAMPEYRKASGVTAELEISQPELLQEINIFTVDWGDHNFGLREDGSVVLIDGGRSTVP